MLEVVVSLKFYLPVGEKVLVETVRLAGFEEKVRPLEASLNTPFGKVRIGAPIIQIAQCESASIEYHGERNMLILRGKRDSVIGCIEKLVESLEKLGYNLDDAIDYIEIFVPPQPLRFKNFIESLRQNIRLVNPIELEGEVLNVWSVSLSNATNPIGKNFYNWFFVQLNPDIYAKDVANIHLIKRTKRVSDCIEFLAKLDALIRGIITNLGGGGDEE